jgi:hypothetical protein
VARLVIDALDTERPGRLVFVSGRIDCAEGFSKSRLLGMRHDHLRPAAIDLDASLKGA